MRFALTEEQRQFGATIHELLADADVPGAARAWADGDHGPGLAIWQALAKAGVTALAVPESAGGLGASPVDLVVAFTELGHHPVPGPLAESIAALPALLATRAPAEVLAALASGNLIGTLALPPVLPFALDADVAKLVVLAVRGTVSIAPSGIRLRSIDPTRRLFVLQEGARLGASADADVRSALYYGTLASGALLLGAGRGLLEASVAHAKTREQFGRPIGAFQAVKHSLANVLIGLEFARPLLYAAAIALGSRAPTAARDLSAARVACADAARLAARTA
ncbi:MAG TPA: acyl-CoA dehydrogenase family protein, partial [Streptosporangiaceae bacterium]|nr:acyl-CoA dehydrogenase family protein [Streptosporangiaceae bacterium]